MGWEQEYLGLVNHKLLCVRPEQIKYCFVQNKILQCNINRKLSALEKITVKTPASTQRHIHMLSASEGHLHSDTTVFAGNSIPIALVFACSSPEDTEATFLLSSVVFVCACKTCPVQSQRLILRWVWIGRTPKQTGMSQGAVLYVEYQRIYKLFTPFEVQNSTKTNHFLVLYARETENILYVLILYAQTCLCLRSAQSKSRPQYN